EHDAVERAHVEPGEARRTAASSASAGSVTPARESLARSLPRCPASWSIACRSPAWVEIRPSWAASAYRWVTRSKKRVGGVHGLEVLIAELGERAGVLR